MFIIRPHVAECGKTRGRIPAPIFVFLNFFSEIVFREAHPSYFHLLATVQLQ